MSTRSIGVHPIGLRTGSNGVLHRNQSTGHQAIVGNKSRLRYTLIVQAIIVLLMTIRLSVALCVVLGFRPPRFLQQLNLPRAWPWEFIWWIGNGLGTAIGLLGLKRNRILFIRLSAIFAIFLGLLPVFYGIYDLYKPFMQYLETHETRVMFAGFPVVVLHNMFLVGVLQLHVLTIAFAHGLLSAWSKRAAEKKKQM